MSAFDDYLAAPAQPQAQSFDAYLGSAAPTPRPAPTQTPAAQGSQPGMLASLGAGLGHGFGSTALGVQQALGHIVPGAIGDWLTNDAAQGRARLDAQYAPYEQANPISAGAGNIGGQIAGTAPAMMIGPEYAGLGLAGRLGVGAAQGAASSAMMPTSDQDFWANKAKQVGLGGLLGGATPLVAAGAGAVGRGLWNAAQPVLQPSQFVGRGLAGAMDPAEAAVAAANIRGAQQFVPGSVPTAAQVAQTPVMVQTEKAAANMPAFKTAMAQRAIDNNNARWQALMRVAQDPAALAAAQTARENAATPLYQQAATQTASVGPGFMKLAQRPAVQQAMAQADQLAANRGETLVWPQAGPTGTLYKSPSKDISGRALDYTNQALGDMIGSAKASGNNSLAAGLADAQSQLQGWTQRFIPAQRQASQVYAQMSVPINTMEVGQQIANGLGTRAMNAGGVPEIQMMPFRSALTSAMNGGDAARYGIDAGALNTLQGIGQDLQRATVSNSIKSPGSDTAYNLAANGWLARQLYGPTFGGAGNVGKAVGALGATALGHPMVGLGILGGANRVGQMVGGRLQDRLSGLLMDPNAILPYLDARAAAPAQAVPGALMQGLLNYGRPAAVNGFLGGFNEPGHQ